jgi:hypothetical protein
VSRRVKLPGADELFGGPEKKSARREHVVVAMPDKGSSTDRGSNSSSDTASDTEDRRGPSGRVRHDEKITVYVTADELLDLERIRLTLRGEHGLAVDRGRLVREAIHLAIEAVERDGSQSVLVERLRET